MEKNNEACFINEHFVGGGNQPCRIASKDVLRPSPVALRLRVNSREGDGKLRPWSEKAFFLCFPDLSEVI